MSFLFGGHKTKPEFTGLATQTSTSNIAIAIGWGENRAAPNIVQQTDFQSHKHSSGGKGGGGKGGGTYTYSGTFVMALGWGQTQGVGTVYKDKELTTLAALGMTFFNGATPQSPWGYMVTNHPTEARGYAGITYIAVANYDLGSSNSLSQHSFEWQALRWNSASWTGRNDADIALVFEDFLSDPTFGVGFDMGFVDSDSLYSGPDATTTGDNALQTYCQAMGWGFSPILSNQVAASDTINRWCQLINVAPVWTGYSLKFLPYCAETITGNGVTYLPSFPVRYTLTDADYLGDNSADPIRFDRADPADCKNQLNVTIANKANQYNDLPAPWEDLALIDQYGVKPDSDIEGKEITALEQGMQAAALIGQRNAYVRNVVHTTVGPNYMRLEPGDVIEAVDPVLGTLTLMVDEVTENDDDHFDLVAKEWNESVTLAPSVTTQAVAGTNVNTGVAASPVNTPILFEPPSTLAERAQVWAAVSGGNDVTADPLWGGAHVWISTDGASYTQIGTINEPARMGVTTAALAAYGGSNPDAVHTLSANLTKSASELISASSPADAAAGANLCYVGGEFLSFETVTPTGTYAFNCTSLYRGLFGSTPGAHLSGVGVARLDNSIFKYDLPADYIGIPLYLKFQSFNVYGGGLQDLSTCTPYTVTPTGAGYGTGTDGVPAAPTGLAVVAGVQSGVTSWSANVANDNVTAYRIYRAAGTGAAFGSAVAVATINALTWTDPNLVAGTGYTFFVTALNTVGESLPSAGVNLTTSAIALLGPIYLPSTFLPGLMSIFTSPISYIYHKFAEPGTARANFGGWQFGASANATGSTVFTVKRALAASPNTFSTIGTITIAAGTITPTFATSGGAAFNFAIGDVLLIVGPGSADATLADVHFSALFDRTA